MTGGRASSFTTAVASVHIVALLMGYPPPVVLGLAECKRTYSGLCRPQQ